MTFPSVRIPRSLLRSLVVPVALLLAASNLSCGSSNSTTNPGDGNTANCDVVALPASISGGCVPTLVSPSKCQVVDLTNGKSFQFAWTTNGTYCETPWTLLIAGNPAVETNTLSWSLSEDVSNGITHSGGIININAASLAGITSTDGVYHWVIAGYYGSHPASVAFRVKK